MGLSRARVRESISFAQSFYTIYNLKSSKSDNTQDHQRETAWSIHDCTVSIVVLFRAFGHHPKSSFLHASMHLPPQHSQLFCDKCLDSVQLEEFIVSKHSVFSSYYIYICLFFFSKYFTLVFYKCFFFLVETFLEILWNRYRISRIYDSD